MNLFNLLEGAARRYPHRPAVYLGQASVCTYRELRSRALALRSWLATVTLPGDRVVIIAQNCPEYLELLFACWAGGIVSVPVNVKLHISEITRVIADVSPKLVFASRSIAEAILAFDRAIPVVEISGQTYQSAAHSEAMDPMDVDKSHLAWLFCTSGTTGRAKGAMLSHGNLLAMSVAHLADFESLESGDSIIHAAPMSHGSGLLSLPYVQRAGAHVIPTSGSFSPAEFLELAQAHERCGAFLAPTMLRRLRIQLEQSRQTQRGIRSIVYGGGPMYLDEIRRCLDVFGPIFCHLYGQGEAPMTITGLRPKDYANASNEVLTSVGWPRSGIDVAIVNSDGQMLPSGEIGEIVCRGDVVMAGYWNDPEATRKTLRDGWLWTGDLGSIDLDGKLRLQGRSKEVVISGGSNIYPVEVEAVLTSHPAVSEACVLGRPDPEWGEIVVAFVVIEPGRALDAQTLDQYCRRNIAAFKRPKLYHFVNALPKNANGKVAKSELAGLA